MTPHPPFALASLVSSPAPVSALLRRLDPSRPDDDAASPQTTLTLAARLPAWLVVLAHGDTQADETTSPRTLETLDATTQAHLAALTVATTNLDDATVPPPQRGLGARGRVSLLVGSATEFDTLATALRRPDADPRTQSLGHAIHRAITAQLVGAPPLQLTSPNATTTLTLTHGQTPAVMGIVNVTPDSFSDGGLAYDHRDAIAHAESLHAAHATILDIGGESTRPGAAAVSLDEELRRVIPVVKAIAAKGHIVSIDTRNAVVAEAALDAGAALVNDVSGLRHDPAMAPLIARRGCPVCIMHSRATPADMQAAPWYRDPLLDVAADLMRSVTIARNAGINDANIILDPGIGFAKRLEDNLALLHHGATLTSLGFALLVGASRKSFIHALTGAPVNARLPGSLAAATLAAPYARILRVHDVAETRQALAVARGEKAR